MAVVKSINKNEPLKLVPWLNETRLLEKKDRESAVKEYKKITAVYPVSEVAYERLMILYRYLKMPKEEISVIKKAIRVFEENFRSKQVKPTAKVAALSKSLIRSMGLADKKGNSYFLPQPIARWTKRKELLEKKQKSL